MSLPGALFVPPSYLLARNILQGGNGLKLNFAEFTISGIVPAGKVTHIVVMASSLLTGLAHKVVLITGSTSGIGRYAAVEFAKNGSRLAISGRRKDALEETANQCQKAGLPSDNILQIQADLEKVEDCRGVVSKAVGKFGQLDVLVNSAGILTSGGIESLSLEDYDKQMNVNARALFITTQAAVPHLKETRGSIVNVSSVTGFSAFPGVVSYCMSKGAVDQLTRCTALDLASYGIRCNSVNPGVIVTSLHKSAGMDQEAYKKFLEHSKSTHALGRAGEAEEVAKAIVFLASNTLSGFITGATLPVDGGRGVMCPR